MVGTLGTETTALQAATLLPRVPNAAVKCALAQAIDYLTPLGSRTVTDQLQRVLAAAEARGDRMELMTYSSVSQLLYRLRVRE